MTLGEGIKIVRESSRHSIEKKLQELEEQKDNGYITLEEYDTLRIRYERKLGNKEAVSKLQESKGFKPSNIQKKQERKEVLYDDFVDRYSRLDVNPEPSSNNSGNNKKVKRTVIILFVLLAFIVGIVAGVVALNTVPANNTTNVTITDSAFTTNQSVVNASNMSANTTNNTTTVKATTKKYSSSSYSSGSSSKSSSSRQSNSKSSSKGSTRDSSGSNGT